MTDTAGFPDDVAPLLRVLIYAVDDGSVRLRVTGSQTVSRQDAAAMLRDVVTMLDERDPAARWDHLS